MYRAIQSQGLRAFASQEAPYAFLALVIAELFYKFHSFVLECSAFLATWYALSFAASRIMRLLPRAKQTGPQ